MIKWILQVIKECWHSPVFDGIRMSTFFRKVLLVYNILETLEIDDKATIALYGNNSYNWIVIYIACLLSGVRLLIIHPSEKPIEVVHIMLLTDVHHVFIDKDLITETLGKNIFLNTLISIQSFRVVFESDKPNHFGTIIDTLVNSEQISNDLYPLLDSFDEDVKSSVITGTSGTENNHPKWVESSTDSISDLITKAIGVMPYNTMDTVYVKSDFADSHFVTVLLPFVKGCEFTGNKNHANIVIEDTNSIENMWYDEISYVYSKFWFSLLSSNKRLNCISDRIVAHKIKNYYGSELKKLMVYNNTINQGLLTLLAKYLPLVTTYGSQETNQLVAINNYSTKEKCKLYTVGTILPGMVITFCNEELEVTSSTLFTKYIGDPAYTREVRFRDNYVTGDIGFINSSDGVMTIYGRKSAIYYNAFKLPIQLDKLERIIKTIPYIKDAMINQIHGKLYLVVYPNIEFGETKKLGYLRLRRLMKQYLIKINESLDNNCYLDDIILVEEPFLKTHDGKIRRFSQN